MKDLKTDNTTRDWQPVTSIAVCFFQLPLLVLRLKAKTKQNEAKGRTKTRSLVYLSFVRSFVRSFIHSFVPARLFICSFLLP